MSAVRSRRTRDIAITGMAGRFPGAADLAGFWELVRDGRETVSRFTEAELAAAGVTAQARDRPGYVAAGGVLDGVDHFDHGLFGYSPRDARLLDPQQRIFLECAWAALENACRGSGRDGRVVGVYASVSHSSYLLHWLRSGRLDEVSLHELLLANDKDTLATRVAYHLDLTGPAVTVQSGCSSSLVAVHLACQAMVAGDCEVALAGGVSVHVPQRGGYQAVPGGIMSPQGHCRPFDHRADGTVNGDGVAAVVLRPLADALADRDTVYAVIRGSAINNDGGRKIGFTAPRAGAQTAVIRAALRAADVPAASIGYVEAHGTGTALGDAIEFAALTEAFDEVPQRSGWCALGSVKALIGHLDAAAGVTGLIKAVLALRHRTLPPSPYFQGSGEEIDLAASPFRIPAEPEAWHAAGGPRRAAVSSFGMGGTNAHIVLEEAPETAPPAAAPSRPAQLLVLSAASEATLSASAERWSVHLRGQRAPAELADIAFTAQLGRVPLRHRLAVVARNRDEAAELLRVRGNHTSAGVAGDGAPAVVFLFPGQGSQHPGMGGGPYGSEPVFRHWLDACADLLPPAIRDDLRAVLRGDIDPARLRSTELAQVALFSVEYALAQTLLTWGVRPAAMLGHSVGEYTAACLSGIFGLPEALRLVAARGRLMQSLPGGAMATVRLPPPALRSLLPSSVSVAARNSAELTVISGPGDAVDGVLRELRERGVWHARLNTSHAFHSDLMRPAVGPFAELVRQAGPRPPRQPFISSVTGDWISEADAVSPAYWASQLCEPVRFHDGLLAALREPGRVLLEVGPGTALTTLARQHDLAGGGHTAVAALGHPRSPEPAEVTLLGALGRLWVLGLEPDWPGFWGQQRQRVPLPSYPFARHHHWFDATPGGESRLAREAVPARGAAGAPAAPAGNAPRPLPETVLAVWQDLLGVGELGPDDDFFALGGHSLLATQLTARLFDLTGIDVAPATLFAAPTLAAFTGLVESRREELDLLAEIAALPSADQRALLGEEADE